MVERDFIVQSLKDLGYACKVGDLEITGYAGHRTKVEIVVPTPGPGFDIGIRKTGDSYEIVADWWGVEGVDEDVFIQKLTQRYAYNVARAKLEEQNFSLVKEEVDEDGRIHMVLRRMK